VLLLGLRNVGKTVLLDRVYLFRVRFDRLTPGEDWLTI